MLLAAIIWLLLWDMRKCKQKCSFFCIYICLHFSMSHKSAQYVCLHFSMSHKNQKPNELTPRVKPSWVCQKYYFSGQDPYIKIVPFPQKQLVFRANWSYFLRACFLPKEGIEIFEMGEKSRFRAVFPRTCEWGTFW